MIFDESGEHAGFAMARNVIVGELLDYMDTYSDEITESPKLWITGYSRAAATANLTANFIV